HTSWDVPLIDNVGQGAMQMADKGFSRGWGLGRHVLGSNFFHYIRDPWGSYAEYSCDIDYIPAEMDWESKDHDPEDSFYIWGPTPPDDFARNYEAE
ncbi:MAG: metapyrocatechase, partial [Mesorhizobium sp.]